MVNPNWIKGYTPWNKGKKLGYIPKTVFKKGHKPWNWKGGKPHCIDCGKEISYVSLRCKSCSRKGAFSWRWKGGRTKTGRHGAYIYTMKKNHPNATKAGYVMEHRLVMEKAIGRRLNKFEQVHHKNGIKNDNRLENLELINSQTHTLITKMEREINRLTKENKKLKERIVKELEKEGYREALK